MSSPYATGTANSGVSSGSAYARATPSPAGGGSAYARASASVPKSRGPFGSIAHFVAAKADLAARDIKSIPGGLYAVDKAAAHDIVHAVAPNSNLPSWLAPSGKGGYQLPGIGKAVAKQVVTSVEHPLRDPFQTLLNVGAVASAGAGAVGRVGAVADAARAGDIAGTAKALVVKPPVAPRVLRSGQGEAALVPSKNPAMRAAQAAYDRLVNSQLAKNPAGRIAAHGQRRIGGALDEEARIQQRMRAVPATRLDRAAAKLSRLPGARREEQAALELASVNTAPEDAAAYHLKQAADGVNPKQNLAVGHLYQRVAARGLLTKNKDGDVIVNPVHQKLATADERLARVQQLGDQALVEKGIRSEDALASRRNAPARIRAGATYEPPTPGKAGISPALVKATAERDRLAGLHEKALQQDEVWRARQNAPVEQAAAPLPSMTAEQARARLEELDRQHDALAQKIVPEVSQYGGKLSQREQLRRNFENSRAGKGKYRAMRPKPTVKSEELQAASDKLHEVAEKYARQPWADNLKSILDERQQLRDALNARAEASISGEKPPALPPVKGARAEASAPVAPADLLPHLPPLGSPYRNRIVTLGHALEVAQDRVSRLEGSVAKRVKPTGIVGGETARPGRGFVSARVSEKKLTRAEASVPSPSGVTGAAKSPIDSKTFTGRSIEQGLVPKDVAGSASRHYRQILKFVNTDAMRRRALQFGSETRRSDRDVLVRLPDETPGELSAHIRQVLGQEQRTHDTADELATQEGLHAAHEAFLHRMIPGLGDRFASDAKGIGTPAEKGYLWVDRGALGDLTKAPFGPRGRTARFFDNVNNSVTAATVYFKVGHLGTRYFTNAATNIIQGSAGPRQIAKSLELWHHLTEEEQARALAASGQHGFAALPHAAGGEGAASQFVSHVAGKGAQWWARRADAIFRFNSLAYEARKAGISSPAEFRKFLDDLENPHGLDAARISKVSAIARRADREAISYDRLNDFERRYITRAFWFYSWTKGATSFAARTVWEHPYKSAALGAGAGQARNRQQSLLGDLPSYEAGLIPLSGGQRPLVTDFSTFSPFATSADVLGAVQRPKGLGGMLNPVYGGVNDLINGADQYGNATANPYGAAASQVFSPTPEAQILSAYLARHADQSKRIFPKSRALGGTRDPLLRMLLGPAVPRRINPQAAHSAAARERAGR
jgi:hypothetical protein